MKNVKDNFSGNAADYATYRPIPPIELYNFLYSHVRAFDTAWDCGTGNGQIAIELANKFNKVYATDISAKQLALAPKRDNITYLEERAEQTSLADNSADLITVAQAVHWFDLEAFNKEVLRVGKKDAIVALITYYTPRIDKEVDAIVDELYWDITRPYWDKERQLVDDKYLTIPFPYKEFNAPSINIVLYWSYSQMIGYLRTWSGVQHYINKKQEDPLVLIENKLKTVWQNDAIKEIKFPLYIRTGQIVK